MKKLLTMMLAVLTFGVASLGVACGGGPEKDDDRNADGTEKTEIRVMNFGGGVGRKWLDEAIEEFKALKANEVYEPGKRGVKFEVGNTTDTGFANMAGAGWNIYFQEDVGSLANGISTGRYLQINDVVNTVVDQREGQDVTIKDKIFDEYEGFYTDAEGNFYGLPHDEWSPGVTYDVELFESKGLYIAAPDAAANTCTPYTCTLVNKTLNFTKNGKKSVGNDGVYGTEDDGLPTSLTEFVTLCDYMYKIYNITPFTVAGGHISYALYFLGGLWASLAGADTMKSFYSFDGTIDVVTGFSTENLFYGTDTKLNTIKKPIVERVTMDSIEDGHYTTQTLAQYYALAFYELAYKQGWFSDDAADSGASHTRTQENFIYSGQYGQKPYAMLIEGSYWYNESVLAGAFDGYFDSTGKTERKLAFMSLPTSYDVSVTEGNGRKQTYVDWANSAAVINANIAQNEGLVRACKEFLTFLYSDAQLVKFTLNSGSLKAQMDYKVDDSALEGLNVFHKQIIKQKLNNNFIYQYANNAKAGDRIITCNKAVLKPTLGGNVYGQPYSAFRAGFTAQNYFEGLKIAPTAW